MFCTLLITKSPASDKVDAHYLKGYLFHWAAPVGPLRIDESESRRSSAAEVTGGKLNLGYAAEVLTGEHVT